MKYILPKNEYIETILGNSLNFFQMNGIKITDISRHLCEDLFCSLVINSFDYILNWKEFNEEEINPVLKWTYHNKRKERNNSVDYDHLNDVDKLSMSLARIRVLIENVLEVEITNSYIDKEAYYSEIMDKYYYHVLDDIELHIKRLVLDITDHNEWNIYNIRIYKRNIELISYGDYRICSWEMNRNKS
jgi:hypothetical protein